MGGGREERKKKEGETCDPNPRVITDTYSGVEVGDGMDRHLES